MKCLIIILIKCFLGLKPLKLHECSYEPNIECEFIYKTSTGEEAAIPKAYPCFKYRSSQITTKGKAYPTDSGSWGKKKGSSKNNGNNKVSSKDKTSTTTATPLLIKATGEQSTTTIQQPIKHLVKDTRPQTSAEVANSPEDEFLARTSKKLKNKFNEVKKDVEKALLKVNNKKLGFIYKTTGPYKISTMLFSKLDIDFSVQRTKQFSEPKQDSNTKKDVNIQHKDEGTTPRADEKEVPRKSKNTDEIRWGINALPAREVKEVPVEQKKESVVENVSRIVEAAKQYIFSKPEGFVWLNLQENDKLLRCKRLDENPQNSFEHFALIMLVKKITKEIARHKKLSTMSKYEYTISPQNNIYNSLQSVKTALMIKYPQMFIDSKWNTVNLSIYAEQIENFSARKAKEVKNIKKMLKELKEVETEFATEFLNGKLEASEQRIQKFEEYIKKANQGIAEINRLYVVQNFGKSFEMLENGLSTAFTNEKTLKRYKIEAKSLLANYETLFPPKLLVEMIDQ
jgi:hypothetical protein